MNTSQFMDKQIMEFAASDLSDLLRTEDHSQAGDGESGGKKEEILPSYEFQPIRTSGSPPAPPLRSVHASLDGAASWDEAQSRSAASNSRDFRNYSSLEPQESSKAVPEKSKVAYDITMVSEIDRAVKKHTDNVLHALEAVSSRLAQLESRTLNLENSLDDLKLLVDNNGGSTDGKLRQLENILTEVRNDVKVLFDKQEIAEAQQQLYKLQASKADQQQQYSSTPSVPQQQSVPTQQHVQQPPQPFIAHQQPAQQPLQHVTPPPQSAPPALSAPPNVPAPLPPLQNQPPSHYTVHVPLSQGPPASLSQAPPFPLPGQPHDVTHPQYQPPVQQPQLQNQPQLQPPQQQYQVPPQIPPYSQPPQQAPSQPPLAHHSEEPSRYMPPHQAYPPTAAPPVLPTQRPSGPSPQQFYGAGSYESLASRPSSGHMPYSPGYGAPSGAPFSDQYSYNGPPSHYSSSSIKPSAFSSSGPPSGGGNYSRLPTAKVLPQAVPIGSSSGGESSGTRVPIDDVVDKVATMGFSRDQVRATVKKLTENGQSVDLNVVLDKLMNGGDRW